MEINILKSSIPVLLNNIERNINENDYNLTDFIFDCFTELFDNCIEEMSEYVAIVIKYGNIIININDDKFEELDDIKSSILTLYGSISINFPQEIVKNEVYK